MIGIIGRKLGMTQIFNETGQQIPVTVVEAEPNPVVKVTTSEKAGFAAVELGLGAQKVAREAKKGERQPRGMRASRAELAHAKPAGLDAPPAVLRSFRLDDGPPSLQGDQMPGKDLKVGEKVTVGVFAVGDTVKVTGTTKGHGFQGMVKRHKAGGGPNTHGNTKHREPGAIAAGTDPSRIIKGKRMPGHFGFERHTQTHLRVEKVDSERNLLYIRGSVAGPKFGIVLVRKQG